MKVLKKTNLLLVELWHHSQCERNGTHSTELQRYLQWDDVRGENVGHRLDILAQGIIFGADTSWRTSGLLQLPGVCSWDQTADGGDPHQQRPSSPSSVCSTRVSHLVCPAPGGLVTYMQLARDRKRLFSLPVCLFKWSNPVYVAGLSLCFLRLNWKGTSPADSFGREQDYKCRTDKTCMAAESSLGVFFFNYKNQSTHRPMWNKWSPMRWGRSTTLRIAPLHEVLFLNQCWSHEREEGNNKKRKFPWERKRGEERGRRGAKGEGEAPRCAFLSAMPTIIYARFRAVRA